MKNIHDEKLLKMNDEKYPEDLLQDQ